MASNLLISNRPLTPTSLLDGIPLGMAPDDRLKSSRMTNDVNYIVPAARSTNSAISADKESMGNDGHFKRLNEAAAPLGDAKTIAAELALLQKEEIKAERSHEVGMALAQARHEADMATEQARHEAHIACIRRIIAGLEYKTKLCALGQPPELSTTRLRTCDKTTVPHPSNTLEQRMQTAGTNTKIQKAPTVLSAESTVTLNKLHDTSFDTNGPVRRTTTPDIGGAEVRPKPIAIRNSASPARIPTGPRADGLRVTCYFWSHGSCTQPPAECKYAHYDTGVIATDPQVLHRFRRYSKGKRRLNCLSGHDRLCRAERGMAGAKTGAGHKEHLARKKDSSKGF